MKAAFIPEVNDELDTQNFEKFDEVSYLFFMLMEIEELIILSLYNILFYLPLMCRWTCKLNLPHRQGRGERFVFVIENGVDRAIIFAIYLFLQFISRYLCSCLLG